MSRTYEEKMTAHDAKIKQGQRLKEFLNDPLIGGFFVEFRKLALRELLACKPEEDHKRLRMQIKVNVTDDLIRLLEGAVRDGLKAEKAMAQLMEKQPNG
ncbi:MAG: hypothetical protein AAF228_12685 [Pseudomonadota bacterium]